MKTLIDMDLVAYRAAASAEEEPVGIAIARMNSTLDLILQKTEAQEFLCFLSGKGSYRKSIYPEYKANRTQPKPKHLQALRDYAIKELEAITTEDGKEADDYLGIYQDKVNGTTTIATLDKDLLMIPGKHYSWEFGTSTWSREEKFLTQTKLGGLKLFYEQCLKGDSADNIKGLAKVGEVKAKRFLANANTEQDMFNIVYDMYGNEEEFLLNARCLWILQEQDDDYINHFERLVNAELQVEAGRTSVEDFDWEVT